MLLLTIRGELAIAAHLHVANLYAVGSVNPNHDAVMRIGGEAPGGGPILSVGIKCQVRIRLPATSDRQFGSRAPYVNDNGAVGINNFSNYPHKRLSLSRKITDFEHALRRAAPAPAGFARSCRGITGAGSAPTRRASCEAGRDAAFWKRLPNLCRSSKQGRSGGPPPRSPQQSVFAEAHPARLALLLGEVLTADTLERATQRGKFDNAVTVRHGRPGWRCCFARWIGQDRYSWTRPRRRHPAAKCRRKSRPLLSPGSGRRHRSPRLAVPRPLARTRKFGRHHRSHLHRPDQMEDFGRWRRSGH